MTARTTTLRGADAGRYYVEDQLGYYLDRGEPPGRWYGAGAGELGLRGDVDEDDFLALMAGVDPGIGRLLGTAHTDRTVRGFDITCSAPKGVSVLFAIGDDRVRGEVVAGHDAAVAAVVDWVERHAHCRYRVRGQVCVFDADGIAAAVFRQHTSRAMDPQLHSHVVIPNRVQAPDGRWLALDARTIKCDQQTLSRLYHAGLRAELTRRLGVRWTDPVNGIADIDGIPDRVLAEFSQRASAVEERIDEKLERFTEAMERDPTPRERWRLERDAVLESRPPKTNTDPTTLEADWRARLDGLGVRPDRVVAKTVGVARGLDGLDRDAALRVVDDALAALADTQSSWRVAELVRELAAAIPTGLAVPADRLAVWLDEVANQVAAARMVDLSRPIPEGMPLRRDGRPVTEAAVDRVLTLPAIVAQEERIVALAERRAAGGGVDHPVGTCRDLSLPQRALAEAVAGTRALVLAVGPAGTGKTTALRPAVAQLHRDGRAVFGVAPSATAAGVLAVDTGVDADTLDKLLVEHSVERPPERRFDLPAGATVLVDEAAMVPTAKLAELFDLADRRRWRLVFTGDPMQFSAVGRSDMFGHLVDCFGAIELDQVHRFQNEWEREASLRLRHGDTTVVDLYDRHGRLRGGTPGQMRRAVINAWWAAIQAGETVAVMAPTNDAVIELNVAAQRRRLAAGQLDPAAPTVTVGPYVIRAGDVVATRHNDRQLVTDQHRMVKNRDRWTVQAIHPDDGLTVSGPTGQVRLPAGYVADHVALAYAETSHANQGRTVDRSLLYLDGPTGTAGIYVPLTRGRHRNDAYVVLHGEQTAADVVAESLARTWIDRPAIAVRAELQRDTPTRPDPLLSGDQLRRLLQRHTELDHTLTMARAEADIGRRHLATLAAQRASTVESITDHEQRLAAAQRTVAEHDRLLVRRRHRFELDSAHRQLEWIPAAIERANAKLVEIDSETTDTMARVIEAATIDERQPELRLEWATIGQRLDHDRRQRADRLAAKTPAAVADLLGPRPHDGAGEALWEEAAGRLAQHHAAYGQPGDDLLGRKPRLIGDEAYAASYWPTVKAIEHLDHALGREPTIEPPGHSLGRSL